MLNIYQQEWEGYKKRELAAVTPMLAKAGFMLSAKQPHLSGERHLMQAVQTESGKKLILLGSRVSDGMSVVIKATSDTGGIREIEHERECRRVLQEINFAYKIFLSPEELFFKKEGGYVLFVQKFIAQECSFLERPLKEQFALGLKGFEAQESAHATTYKHIRLIQKTFGTMGAALYLTAYDEFVANSTARLPEDIVLRDLLTEGARILQANALTIEQYCGFLTHTDFVPHNLRIVGSDIYLLDHSSLRFGNKYEGWARFLNFMTLYNRPLEEALLSYVKNNRSSEEYESLTLMRIFRLGEILWFYINLLSKTSDALHELTVARVAFWKEVLAATLKGERAGDAIVEEYQHKRDSLRTEEEKERQQGLH